MEMIRSIQLFFIASRENIRELNWEFLNRSSKYAFQNIIRNPIISLSSVFVITLVLILFHSSVVLKYFAEQSLMALNKKIDLIVEVQEGIDVFKLDPLITSLKKNEEVTSVKFVDKAEALRAFLERHSNIKVFLQKYRLENPLPSTLEITTSSPEALSYALERVKDPKYGSYIHQGKIASDLDQKTRIEKLIRLGEFVKSMSNWFFMVFVVVSIFIIFNTINIAIHHRKEEIHIMSLVGATKFFIQAPYVMEGIFYSIFAIIIGTVLNLFLHLYIVHLIDSTLTNQVLVSSLDTLFGSFLSFYPIVVAQEFLLLLTCSVIAAFVAIELYLKKHKI